MVNHSKCTSKPCLHVHRYFECVQCSVKKTQLYLYTPWLIVYIPGFLCNFSTDTFTDSYYETYYDRHHPLSNPPIGRQQEGIPGTRRRIMEDIAENEVSWQNFVFVWRFFKEWERKLCVHCCDGFKWLISCIGSEK